MAGRPSTPPRHTRSGDLPPNPLTPEQVRRTEEARLKAKAQRAAHDATTRSNSSTAGQKRTHAQISSSSNVPSSSRNAAELSTPAADAAVQLRPAKNIGKYIEYDFSKMSDTKGGFLSAADDPHNKALGHADAVDPLADKPAHMTVKEWERQQLLTKLRAAKAGPFEPGLSVLSEKETQKVCRECGALSVDWTWVEVFGCVVCAACKEKVPEKYSLLTKTEAREDYLLTNEELQDEDLLPHLKRPNPHKSHWHDMQLYLRYQVEDYAFSARRWGSQEALDAEFERRDTEKKARKEKKFKTKLEDLKKRTRTEAYRRNYRKGEGTQEAEFGVRIVGRNDRHVHEWGRAVMDPQSGVEVKSCVECGMECEEIEL